MTKLKRFTGKVFGGSATAVGDDPQIAQFGSALANTFVGTTDPEIIQQLPAWGQGWIGAVTPTQQYPALPEMTGAMKVLSHQICGILQQGVSTWDSGTIYYTGNFASKNGRLYISQIDENQGNDPAIDTTNWQEFSSGGGLEIGDVAFTQMAIDESKNKRRKLNGQIIVQEQFQELTNILKSSVALNPDMACTEQEWQAEVTMSTAGICYKFVVDDEGGTIRLPKYPDYFIGGGNAPVVGNGLTLGLTNGIDNYGLQAGAGINGDNYEKAFSASKNSYGKTAGSAYSASNLLIKDTAGVTTDPDNSGIEALLGNAELIKGTYFIQVATGSETEDNIVNTLELNNPFVLLEPKYFENEIYNISWLLANGTYNGSNAVHPSAYQALLVENNTEIAVGSTVTLPVGTDYTKRGLSVKLSTDSDITDYDFVINTTDETFRLPIKVNLASGKAVVGNGMTLGITNGTTYGGVVNATTDADRLLGVQALYGESIGTSSVSGSSMSPNNVAIGITTDPTKSGIELSDQDLYLYFYVGETVQNANLVNVGRIEEKITEALAKPHIIESYVNGTEGYNVYSNGYCEQWGQFFYVANGTITLLKEYKAPDYCILLTDTDVSDTGGVATSTAVSNRTANSITLSTTSEADNIFWKTCGYIA